MYRRRLRNPRQEANDVCWIEMSTHGKRYFNILKNNNPDEYYDMLMEIVKEMRSIPILIMNNGWRYIYSLVPSDTGKLRANLLQSLRPENSIIPRPYPRSINDIHLRIGLFTTIKYAKYVEKFKTSSLSHKHGKKSGSERVYRGRESPHLVLHDPKAKAGYMDKIRNKLKKTAIQETRRMLNNLAIIWGWDKKEVRSLFVMKNYGFHYPSLKVKII